MFLIKLAPWFEVTNAFIDNDVYLITVALL